MKHLFSLLFTLIVFNFLFSCENKKLPQEKESQHNNDQKIIVDDSEQNISMLLNKIQKAETEECLFNIYCLVSKELYNYHLDDNYVEEKLLIEEITTYMSLSIINKKLNLTVYYPSEDGSYMIFEDFQNFKYQHNRISKHPHNYTVNTFLFGGKPKNGSKNATIEITLCDDQLTSIEVLDYNNYRCYKYWIKKQPNP
jgi:hypothetical protein